MPLLVLIDVMCFGEMELVYNANAWRIQDGVDSGRGRPALNFCFTFVMVWYLKLSILSSSFFFFAFIFTFELADEAIK